MTALAPQGALATALRVGGYPGALALGFGLYAVQTALGLSPALAAIGSATLGALIVMAHEALLPYRAAWRPGRAEVATDAVYLALVQVLLPRVMTFAIVAGVAAAQGDGARAAIWPHDWPAGAQLVLMLLSAEFLRYWTHRAFHRFGPMWRLHEIHHSPDRLYWLNVGRFHPLEKMLQHMLDTAPFLLLGVGVEPLALYFVYYAINGFYEHSNCDVRLGPLNYLVAGPELHRWHHSLDTGEANHNFGNTLIVWDLVFGTRFLPKDRAVAALGAAAAPYPSGFLAQLLRPFRRGA
jgi:ornithine lipid hydroxylase